MAVLTAPPPDFSEDGSVRFHKRWWRLTRCRLKYGRVCPHTEAYHR